MRNFTRASIITGAVLAAGALTFSASAANASAPVDTVSASTVAPVAPLPALSESGFTLLYPLGGVGDVEIVGLHAQPGATVTIVQDGTATVTAKADEKGGWHAVLPTRGFTIKARQLAISQSLGGQTSPVTNYTSPRLG
ncbi:hypothetical protein [Frondihabitans australicus]|uniref:Bacterial Ig domain-containing protein n=1 Tax=Frondihabitans australicus TaxID=386892 RepID=A0A495IE29_9MICO|nr:hypothetical protein [Frondihabitans australicus]RKR74263.1 hypothetical protein C8E83_1372 [Frondihabitans australicus]